MITSASRRSAAASYSRYYSRPPVAASISERADDGGAIAPPSRVAAATRELRARSRAQLIRTVSVIHAALAARLCRAGCCSRRTRVRIDRRADARRSTRRPQTTRDAHARMRVRIVRTSLSGRTVSTSGACYVRTSNDACGSMSARSRAHRRAVRRRRAMRRAFARRIVRMHVLTSSQPGSGEPGWPPRLLARRTCVRCARARRAHIT